MPDPTTPGNPLAAGAVMSSLPMDHMIAGPLLACIQAEIRSGKMYADWVQSVGMDENKKAIMIDFEYSEDVLDGQGNIASTNVRKFKIPLLAILQHPSIGVERATVDFEMTVETSEASHSSTEGEGSFEAKAGWGPFSVKISGKVSHKSEQTRKTDTRSKYSFHVDVVHRGPTECMQRVMDHITDASIRPALGTNAGPST
jgi:hypothetical protein